MKVKFYILQRDDKTGNTRHKFLFTSERDLLMVGQPEVYKGIRYQVKELEWIDRDIGLIKAVCLEVPTVKEQK